jgi:hypothetical protein
MCNYIPDASGLQRCTSSTLYALLYLEVQVPYVGSHKKARYFNGATKLHPKLAMQSVVLLVIVFVGGISAWTFFRARPLPAGSKLPPGPPGQSSTAQSKDIC